MSVISTRFQSERAPCGRVVDGEHYESQDEQGLYTDQLSYSCGCQTTRQEYHDGSFDCRTVRHDGDVMVDELATEHGAWSWVQRRRHRGR
jgi:hypothetical protein